MVRRAIEILCTEVRGLHQAASLLALFTIGSQLLALIRDRLLAHQFGAGLELDLYYAAFRVPDLLYVIFASALSAYVLIPFLSERLAKGGERDGRAFLSEIFSLFLAAYTLLALAAALGAPFLATLLFPGFAEHTDTLAMLMRIMLLQPLLLGISSLIGTVTQIRRRFVMYAVSPLLYNIGIIAGIVFLYPYFGLAGLALGVVLGALGHLAVQLPFIAGSRVAPRLTTAIHWPRIGAVLATSLPRALTLSLHQFAFLVLVGFASTMAVGSVSVFQFGFNLQSVPLAIIGVSYSVASFPALAGLYAAGKMDAFRSYLETALRHIIFWSLPLTALLIVVRAQFVRVVLGSGAFGWDDTRLVAAVLALLSLSLLAQGLNLLVVRALYAAGNTRLPFFITLVSTAGMLGLAIALHACFTAAPACRAFIEALMRVESVPGTEVMALALAYAAALIVHSIALLIFAAPTLGLRLSVIARACGRGVAAAVLGGGGAYLGLGAFAAAFPTDTLLTIFAQGFVASVCGAAIAGLTYVALRSDELGELSRALRRRFRRSDTLVAPQDEDTLAM